MDQGGQYRVYDDRSNCVAGPFPTWSQAEIWASSRLPDGYVIIHHRMTDTLYFGPFDTWAETQDWLRAHHDVRGIIVPLYRTVDWNR